MRCRAGGPREPTSILPLSSFSHGLVYLARGRSALSALRNLKVPLKNRRVCFRIAVCIHFLIGRLGLPTAGENEFSKTNQRLYYQLRHEFAIKRDARRKNSALSFRGHAKRIRPTADARRTRAESGNAKAAHIPATNSTVPEKTQSSLQGGARRIRAEGGRRRKGRAYSRDKQHSPRENAEPSLEQAAPSVAAPSSPL